jgi:hypothetical protein
MADPIPQNATNDTPGKTHKITITCNELWSSAQQFSYLRLSDGVDENHFKLIGLYAARARRIAATYARFYLETEQGGNTSKIGRYYWMALGAFASKTVACLLDTWQLNTTYAVGKASTNKENEANWFGKIIGTVMPDNAHNIANGLGQGNLWLFSDIAPTHWFYSHYPNNFFSGMACLEKRDCEKLVEPIKSRVKALPWASKSLSKINNFIPIASGDLIKGFELVVKIETATNRSMRRSFQLDHLLAIANHEQHAILQNLIYDDPEFKKWTAYQRGYIARKLAPDYVLAFSHQCSIDDEFLKSEAPNDMIVEDFASRMIWIGSVANQFHRLMDVKSSYMLAELSAMTSWVKSPDAKHVY